MLHKCICYTDGDARFAYKMHRKLQSKEVLLDNYEATYMYYCYIVDILPSREIVT